MVHALERAGRLLRSDGVVVLIQPHRTKRPFVAVVSGRRREPVAALVSPLFQPLLDSAVGAVRTVVAEGHFVHLGTTHRQFRVLLANPAQLRRYIHLPQRPPRFPAGARRRFNEVWRAGGEGAQIEVTESFSVFGLRRV